MALKLWSEATEDVVVLPADERALDALMEQATGDDEVAVLVEWARELGASDWDANVVASLAYSHMDDRANDIY